MTMLPGSKPLHWADRLPAKLLLGAIIPALMIFFWWLAGRSGTAVVPSIMEVLKVLADPFEPPADMYSSSLAFSLLMTLLRLVIGFGLGVVTAVPLGLLAGSNRVIDRILGPSIQMSRAINPIVLLPIAVALFGLSSIATILAGGPDAWKHDVLDQVQLAMIFILWWGAFFPVFVSTVHGVKGVRAAYLETMEMMGADSRTVFRRVIFPHALPSIANGMRIGMGVTWLVLLAAEVFPGTRSGLGYMLCTACKTSDYQYTFAAMILIAVLGLSIDTAMSRFEKRAGHWRSPER
ncbi:MAG: ABC transporter permease [Nitrospirae bacterium]|nr:MAG: ABC transporter permease [Nitrospirota bacterium]